MTEKQRRFADEYLRDLNGTRAYMDAYGIQNRKNAGKRACNLLKNKEVREYIDNELEKIHSEKTADVKEVMEYLTAVMRGEKTETVVIKVVDEKTEYVPDENGKMRRVAVKKEIPVKVEVPAKVSDCNKAADLLGKRYGMFSEKTETDSVSRIIFMGENEIPE